MTDFNSKGEAKKGICFVENGCLYWNNGSGDTIQEPSLLVCEDDKDGSCTLIRYGEAALLQQEMLEKSKTYAKAGLGHLSIITCNPNQMTLQDQCYVLRRAAEHSASPFVGELFHRLNTDPGGVLLWLHSEMERVPIEI